MTTAEAAPTVGRAPAAGSGGGGRRLVLELVDVTKVYPSSPPVTAVKAVSLSVAAGELIAVLPLAPSG